MKVKFDKQSASFKSLPSGLNNNINNTITSSSPEEANYFVDSGEASKIEVSGMENSIEEYIDTEQQNVPALDSNQISNSNNNGNSNSNLPQTKPNELNTIGRNVRFTKEHSILYITGLSLSSMLIIMQLIISTTLERIEQQKFFPILETYISPGVVASKYFIKFSKTILAVVSSKDAVMIYIGILYTVTQPLIAFKILLAFNLLHYLITLLKCLYQSNRPFWVLDEVVPLCNNSFGNPSNEFFIISFFMMYSIITVFPFNRSDKSKTTTLIQIFSTITHIAVVLLSAIIFLVNKINYLHQIVFTLGLSLFIICNLMLSDKMLSSFIGNATQNTFTMRKYKVKFFFFGVVFIAGAVVINLFMDETNLNVVRHNLMQNTYCSFQDLTEIGFASTFMDVTYIIGIVGSFWGMALTVECHCKKWWKASYAVLTVRAVVVGVFGVAWILFFKYLLQHQVYEFDFVVNCVKYFYYYYLVMGVFPLMQSGRGRMGDLTFMREDLLKDTIFASKRFVNKKYEELKDIGGLMNLPIFGFNRNDNDNEIGEQIEEKEVQKMTNPNLYKRSTVVKDCGKQEQQNIDFEEEQTYQI